VSIAQGKSGVMTSSLPANNVSTLKRFAGVADSLEEFGEIIGRSRDRLPNIIAPKALRTMIVAIAADAGRDCHGLRP
jgi:hypothetical protein